MASRTKLTGSWIPCSKKSQAEILGLLKKGVFEITLILDVLEGTRIFKSRFVNKIKNKGLDKAFKKSRLVVQAYGDDEKQLVLT